MSKITNDHLTRYGTGCFIAVPIWQQSTSYLEEERSFEVVKVDKERGVVTASKLKVLV